MSSKYIIVILAYALVGLGFVSAGSIEVYNRPSPAVPTPTPALFSLVAKIGEGIALLKSSRPLDYELKTISYRSGRKVKTNKLVRKQIALAILDKGTGAVFEKRVWVREEEIKKYRETGVVNLEPGEAAETLNIQPRWWNSFNTFYQIDDPDLVVVANRYLLQSKQLAGLPEKSKNPYTEIIYVPYSGGLHTVELIEAGKQYINDQVDAAFAELEANKVPSRGKSARGEPANLATAGISREFIKNIILVEHIDPDAFEITLDQGRELSERVLVIIGANHKSAYRYTGSPAGATGLAQFIKSTYTRIAAQYPRAIMIKDYPLGMADHTNAVKAMVLFFDSHRAEIENKIQRRDKGQQLGVSEEMLAAAYNGGPSRVIRSVNKFGLAWIGQQFDLPKTKRIFRAETLGYIKKFRSVSGLNIFGN